MNPCSGCVRSLRTLMVVFSLAMSPALARASPPAPDSALATPTSSSAVHADSATTHLRSGLPPVAALGVGLAATVVPTLLAFGMTATDTKAENWAVTIGVVAGAVAGPAAGLWSGGRDDLARRGLLVRSLGAAICVGSYAGASALWDEGQHDGLAVALGIVGTTFGAAVAGSMIHDLAITPSATAHGRPVSAGLGLRPDGKVALNLRF